MQKYPNPGSKDAIAAGCMCPIIDNGYGRGYRGGVRDENGEIVYVISADCPIHGLSERLGN